MTIKRIEKTDVQELFDIHANYYTFPFPNLANPLYAIQRVVRNDKNNIILAGIIKLTSEGIFITNKNLSEFERMKGIKLLNDQLEKDSLNFGLEDCHVFSENNDNFINILHKLGFVDCTGHALVRSK